jgi:mRNA interferase RelE/StbE
LAHYTVSIKRSAIKELEELPEKVFEAIDRKIIQLESDPRPVGIKKLFGAKSLYRIRYRSFRIVYEIDDSQRKITVLRIKHRKEAY